MKKLTGAVVVVCVVAIFCSLSCNGNKLPVASDSLTTTDYIAKGIPSPKRVWTAQEFATAVAILDQLKKTDVNLLPIKDGKKSGELFARLISEENLTLLSDSSADINLRINEFIKYDGALVKLVMFYYDPKNKIQQHGTESVYVMSHSLKVMQAGMDAIQILRKVKPSEQVEKGYAIFESGLITTTRGELNTLGENESYKKEDLIYLSSSLKPFIENTWKFHDENSRQELLLLIKSIISKTNYEEVRENLKDVRLD